MHQGAIQAGTPFSADEPLDRQLLLEMTLHAADLSGPVRPWGVSRVWAGKVRNEASGNQRVIHTSLLHAYLPAYLLAH